MRSSVVGAIALFCCSVVWTGCTEQVEEEVVPPGAIPAAPDVRPGAEAGPAAPPVGLPGDTAAEIAETTSPLSEAPDTTL